MNGIEKITARIAADAQAEADALLAEAKAQAEAISRQWAEQAEGEAGAILARGERAAAERVERLESVAHLEGRKRILAAKQEMLDAAFDKAMEQLAALPQEDYVNLLAKLAATAALTGQERLILSPADRTKVGKAVIAKANELLGNKGKLTLDEEARPIPGGLILTDGAVELNCAFDVLIRLKRPELERLAADTLFA